MYQVQRYLLVIVFTLQNFTFEDVKNTFDHDLKEYKLMLTKNDDGTCRIKSKLYRLNLKDVGVYLVLKKNCKFH